MWQVCRLVVHWIVRVCHVIREVIPGEGLRNGPLVSTGLWDFLVQALVVSNVAQSSCTSPRPSSQALRKLASSVKGKKTIARGPHLKAKPIITANPLSNSFTANIISISFDHVAPLTREKCGSTDHVFEFTTHSLAGQEHHGDPSSSHLDDAGKVDSPTDQGNDDENVNARSNHCFSEGSNQDDAGAVGMELEDRVGAPSSV